MEHNFTDTISSKTSQQFLTKLSVNVLRWSSFLLVTTVWSSAGLFGLYILAFYVSALYEENAACGLVASFLSAELKYTASRTFSCTASTGF